MSGWDGREMAQWVDGRTHEERVNGCRGGYRRGLGGLCERVGRWDGWMDGWKDG